MSAPERWKPVVGFEELYEVSDQGRVRSAPRQGTSGVVLRQWYTGGRNCYLGVDLYRDGFKHKRRVHRLVLEAFDGLRPKGKQCRHLNGDPEDNRLGNLAWGTPKENGADRVQHAAGRTA